MYKKLLKSLAAAMMLLTSANAFAQIDSYEVGDMGYLRTPMETANGIILTNSEYSEIYALDGNKLTPILQERNCGLYTNLSPNGKYLGFKSFNDADEQAPAILDVTTGVVTLLEDYTWECGQVSFANDGTMAYTMGNRLIVRKGNTRKAFDLGFYTNIANISPDATKVAYSNIDGRMYVIDVTSGAKEFLPVNDGYRPIWSPDGSKIAIQIGNGTLAVQERTTKKVYNLGQGESVSWANNSEELIFTQTERINDFEIAGTSIKKVNFDGTGELTLVTSSDNLPTDAIITRDNKLYVPYKTGEKRGLVVKNLVEGITPSAASAKEETIISFDEETIVGLRHSNPNDNPNIKPNPIPAEGTIGALDIPYYSQIYDSPAVNGCTSHGHVTCAPTSACMYLGYYDLLPQKTTYRRSDGTALKYAHAISATFTNKAGTTTFSTTAYGNGCYNVPGGYGYMWNGSRSPSGGYMASFMKLNGCTSADYLWTASGSWNKFVSESAAGRPSPLCVYLRSSGHLILGFRTNCTYTTAGGFVTRTGSFVCHDPYGDANDTTWADDDGQHSSYDWLGYNSGRRNIGTYCWSIYATVPAAANPVEAKITCNPSLVTLKTVYQSTNKPYTDVKITATGLSKNMSVNSINSTVTITKLDGWNDLTGGTIRVTINPDYTLGMGAYAGYIAVQSGSGDAMIRQEIITDISITDADGNIPTDEEPVAPDDNEDPGTSDEPSYTFDDQNIVLTEGWNFSTNGTAPSYIDLTDNVVRAAAYQNGKLYILQNKAWATPVVTIVDAYTGAQLGTLDMTGIGSATIQLSDILAVDGKIIGCGCVTATQTLRIYQWASDTAAPTVLLEQVTGKIMGGSMSISGNLTNGRLWFTNDGTTEAYYYTVSNGAVNSTLNTISLMKANGTDAWNAGDGRGSAEVILNSDGTLWIDAKDEYPALFTVSGTTATLSKTMNATAFGSNKYGAALKFITFGDRKLAASVTYKSSNTNGQLVLLDVAAGVGSETALDTRPTAGLGATANAQRVSTVCAATDRNDGMSLDIWVAVNGQGVAYYYYDGKKGDSSAIEDIFTEDENIAPVEYYNLQGMKVTNPQGGIFIKIQGNKVTKEYIR